jgi:hypothetical protein
MTDWDFFPWSDLYVILGVFLDHPQTADLQGLFNSNPLFNSPCLWQFFLLDESVFIFTLFSSSFLADFHGQFPWVVPRYLSLSSMAAFLFLV